MDKEIELAIYKAELSLLGAILIDASDGSTVLIKEIREEISPDDFYFPIHRNIYIGMLKCKKAPHENNLMAELAESNLLIKGTHRQVILAEAECPTALDYKDYIEAIKRLKLFVTPKEDNFRGAR